MCRSPFLTYHHFDPPWEPQRRHHEHGMIALCSEHHRFADGGNYSNSQLYTLKQNPPSTPPKGRLPWHAQRVFIMFGGNYFVAHKDRLFAFRVDGRDILSFRLLNDGYLSINAAIYNKPGDLVCKIDENDIIASVMNLGDLKCAASGKEIEISSHRNEAFFALRYDRKTPQDLSAKIAGKWPKNFGTALKKDKTEKIRGFIESVLDDDRRCPTITLVANVYSPHVPIRTLGKGISADFRPIGYDKVLMTGLDAGEGGVRFVYSNTDLEMLYFGSREH